MVNNNVFKPKNHDNTNMLPGNLQGLPDESFFETIVFIDEAFLSKLSKYFGKGKYLKFDRFLFAKSLAERERLILKDVFLYLAPPFQSANPSEDEEKRKVGYDTLIDKLKQRGIIVREGRCQRLKIDNKFHYGQKAVDILLAMDLMSVPIKYPSIKKIILISSDSDFVPVVQILEEQKIQTILCTYYEKERNTPFSRSNHLIKSAHKYVLLAKEDFYTSAIIKEGGNK